MANIDLSKYGITGVTEIVHNPSYEMLFAALQTLQSCGWTRALRSRRQPSPGKKEC